MTRHPIRTTLTVMLLILATVLPVRTAHAQSTDAQAGPGLEAAFIDVHDDGLGVRLHFGAPGAALGAASVAAETLTGALPTVRYQGYDLPMQLISVIAQVGDVQAAASSISLESVESIPWSGALEAARTLIPPALDWETNPHLMHPQEVQRLPDSPVFLYSQGRMRGTLIRVIAVSPLFEQEGVVRLATHLRANVAGVSLMKESATEVLQRSAVTAASVDTSDPAAAAELAPSNRAATYRTVKIIVRKGGVQKVTGAALAAIGHPIDDVDKVRIRYRGEELAIETRDANKNGKLEGEEYIRFYAPGAGDYWNSTEVYWLTVGSIDGLRMARRDVTPGSAPSRTAGVEQGLWRNNNVYMSQYGGIDEDHWFAKDMKVDPGMQGDPSQYPSIIVDLGMKMPPAIGGNASFTPQITTYIRGEYQLRVAVAGQTENVFLDTAATGTGTNDWLPEIVTGSKGNNVVLTMIPGDTTAGMLLDAMAWSQPVRLDFDGNGMFFSGVSGNWRYNVTNAPPSGGFYDITEPMKPIKLTGFSDGFEDGPSAYDYVYAGPGVSQIPTLELNRAISLLQIEGADALYIAPQHFAEALQPLVALRESQGYRVAVVDVQELYDGWSYGHVDPEAIRTFLRYTLADWSPAPISVVLVGDGTRDPFNYEARDYSENFIPPYMKTSYLDEHGYEKFVDPWLGQNGCDNCYVQLDGDDPLNNAIETPGKGFMPDMWLGRIPAKSADEVAGVVAKILTYETRAPKASWSGTAAFLADDFIRPNGSSDSAGDFVVYSDDIVAILPGGIKPERVYYNPTQAGKTVKVDGVDVVRYTGMEPWHEPDADTVRDRAIALADAGPGLLTYNGHANHWQWAGTDVSATNPYIFGLFDTDLLSNRDAPFISLAMTCYTSQFFIPANSGTTLDERMFLNPRGGAAASWGPSGLSVLHGHDDLQYGFHSTLWAAEPGTARIGALVAAGYLENMAPSPGRNKLYACCEDVRRTFLLMGDPLMTVRMDPSVSIYLPFTALQ